MKRIIGALLPALLLSSTLAQASSEEEPSGDGAGLH